MRRPRLPRIVLIPAIMFCVVGAAFVSFVTMWVPTKGKAWLEAELERTFPVDASIGAMRYALLRGIVLDQVRIDGREARETWFAAPTITVGITWPALLHRQLIFRAIAPITAPCHTDLDVNGHYALRAKTLALHIRTTDSELAGLAPFLKRHLPPSLTDGRVRLNLHLTRMPAELPTISGQVIGSGLVWTTPTAILRGQLTADGTVMPPEDATGRWLFGAALALREGTLDGPAPVGTITDLTGTGHIDNDRLEIASLTGRALGSPWMLEGTLAPLKAPSVEFLLSTTADTAPLAVLIPALKEPWRIAGPAEVRAVGRGPLSPRPVLDWLVRVEPTDVTLTGPHLPSPVTQIAGRLRYDVLERHLVIDRLHGQMDTVPVNAAGDIVFRPEPSRVTLMLGDTGSLRAAFRIEPTRLMIDDGVLSLPQSRLRLGGFIATNAARPSTLHVNGVIELSELTHLPLKPLPALEPWEMTGAATVTAKFRGPLADWASGAMQARVTADRLSVRNVSVEQLTCDIEQADGILRLGVPSALVAGGKFLGVLSLEPAPSGTRYTVQSDVVQLQLASLTRTIPAWKSRPVTGMASAHVAMTGFWQDRSSWRGEGWLNAEGEQLGEIPLLNKVFRGLFGILGDRLGLESLRRAQITQASLRWQLAQARFHSDDVRLGGLAGDQPVAIYAHGSVGLDQTLDLVVEPELSEGIVLEAPTTSTLARTVLKAAGGLERLRQLVGRHRLTGTLKEPQYRFEVTSQDLLKQLAPGPGDILQGLFDSLR